MSSNRDYTKYKFESKEMGKARLVLALVKRYVHDHPSVTFEELRAAFPDKLQADSPLQFDEVQCVVSRLGDIPQASLRHFFRKEQERVQLGEVVVLVSREWNLHNIENVLAQAERLGYPITSNRDWAVKA